MACIMDTRIISYLLKKNFARITEEVHKHHSIAITGNTHQNSLVVTESNIQLLKQQYNMLLSCWEIW